MRPRLSTLVLAFLLGLALLPALGHAQALPTPANWVRFLDMRCYAVPNQPALNVTLVLSHLNPVMTMLPVETVVLGAPNQLCVPVRKNAQVIPADVLAYLRWLDWKCYAINGPPLNITLTLTHLNPAIPPLVGYASLPVVVREPQQLCVPVRKNAAVPPAAVLELIRWVDVKCYRVETTVTNPNAPITLNHLNPLFAALPAEATTIVGPTPAQLCVPVAKNGALPPAAVLQHVRYSDVLCYRAGGLALNQMLQLTHLNQVLVGMGLPVENVLVTQSQELCVPVAKNGMLPPG